MDDKKMKTTAPVPPVGADGGQPISQKPTPSITEDCAENNPPEKDLDEMLQQMQRFNAPAYLPTIFMNDLYENVYQSRPPVIDGLLYTGAFLLQKERRTDNAATLDISGRDQQDQRLYLTRDEERLVWQLERAETELRREPARPGVGGRGRSGTGYEAQRLSMRLNVRAWRLSYEYHIRYESARAHAGRSITLTLEPPQA